jgi:hypothetical protein
MLGSLLSALLLLLSAASVMISFTLALYTTWPPRSVMPAKIRMHSRYASPIQNQV